MGYRTEYRQVGAAVFIDRSDQGSALEPRQGVHESRPLPGFHLHYVRIREMERIHSGFYFEPLQIEKYFVLFRRK